MQKTAVFPKNQCAWPKKAPPPTRAKVNVIKMNTLDTGFSGELIQGSATVARLGGGGGLLWGAGNQCGIQWFFKIL